MAGTTITLGTATPGGGFPVYGEAFVDAINALDPALEIEAVNTKGSTENVPMLEAGTLDIALVQGEVVHEALTGIGRPPADLKMHHGDVSDRRACSWCAPTAPTARSPTSRASRSPGARRARAW